MNPAPDANVRSVVQLLESRSAFGLLKYGVTTERTDLDFAAWLLHAQQEALDLAVYLQRLRVDAAALIAGHHSTALRILGERIQSAAFNGKNEARAALVEVREAIIAEIARS